MDAFDKILDRLVALSIEKDQLIREKMALKEQLEDAQDALEQTHHDGSKGKLNGEPACLVTGRTLRKVWDLGREYEGRHVGTHNTIYDLQLAFIAALVDLKEIPNGGVSVEPIGQPVEAP